MPMRALAVADVYEALTSARPYRPARSSELALELIRSDTPHRLDPDAVSALETMLRNPSATPVTRLPTPIICGHLSTPDEIRRRCASRPSQSGTAHLDKAGLGEDTTTACPRC